MANTTTNRQPSPAASLRTPVRIDKQVQTKDTRGGYSLSWATLFSSRAERKDLSGGETLRAMQVSANQMKRYKLRWPPSIPLDATLRLVDLTDNAAYNIRNIDGPDQMYRWVTLLCEQIPGSTGA